MKYILYEFNLSNLDKLKNLTFYYKKGYNYHESLLCF